MHQFHKFILSWNSTCFGQFICPSSGVYSLYTQQWYMSYSFWAWPAVPSWLCSKAVYKPVWHIPLLRVQWINSWWWTDELSETCRVSWQNKFVKLVQLVGFITNTLHMCICWFYYMSLNVFGTYLTLFLFWSRIVFGLILLWVKPFTVRLFQVYILEQEQRVQPALENQQHCWLLKDFDIV